MVDRIRINSRHRPATRRRCGVLLGLLLGLLLAHVLPGAASAAPLPSAALQAAAPETYVMVAGNRRDVNNVTSPFITDGRLRLLRDYPDPAAYLKEAPGNLYPNGLPNDLVLRLFLVTERPDKVDGVLDALESAAAQFSTVRVIYSDTTWLSYLPGEIILQGRCALFNTVAAQYELAVINVFNPEYAPSGSELCFGNFALRGSGNVATTVAAINASFQPPKPPNYPDLWAEPNFLTTGAPGNSYVVGSPAAMTPGAEGRTTPDSGLGTTGKGVQVFIFDTSPYKFSGSADVVNIKGIDVEVRHPYLLPATLPQALGAEGVSLSGHGTFVATGIVELAPDAEVVLVRVLNDDAFGAVATIMQALNDVAKNVANSGASGIIFNYSFGLEVADSDGEQSAQTAALWRLHSLLYEAGIVQVAASGNGSAFADAPLPATLPASHPHVIGVTAAAADGRLACYANAGDIGAPGGGLARGADCRVNAMVEACARGADHCLVGWDPNSTTDQSFGVGTSFAAPLVSGVAAQIIEKVADGRAPGNPDDVWNALAALARPSAEPAFGVGTLLAAVPTAVGLRALRVIDLWPLAIVGCALLAGTLAALRRRRA